MIMELYTWIKPGDVLEKTIELVENGCIGEEGMNTRRFVENYGWDNVVEDFEGILEWIIRGVITFKSEGHIHK